LHEYSGGSAAFRRPPAKAAIIMSPVDASASSTRGASICSGGSAINQSGLWCEIRDGNPLHGVEAPRPQPTALIGALALFGWVGRRRPA
jgi:hypothetical protein